MVRRSFLGLSLAVVGVGCTAHPPAPAAAPAPPAALAPPACPACSACPPGEATATPGAAIAPERVLAVVTLDLTGDGGMDRALLLQPDEQSEATDAELLIVFADPVPPAVPPLQRFNAEGLAWIGGLWGTQPELEVINGNSLVVVSQNEAIGRNRFRQRITLAYRDGKLVVVAYEHMTRDTLDPDAVTQCAVDFLGGAGTRDGKPFTVPPEPPDLAAWSAALVPAACSR